MNKKERLEHARQTEALIECVDILKAARYHAMMSGNREGKRAYMFALQVLHKAIPEICMEATRRGVAGCLNELAGKM